MDAGDKILPVLRLSGRFVVELYNAVRPHSARNYRPPVRRTFALLPHLDETMPMQ